MAANEGSKYTNFSNVEIGTVSGGGGLKVAGVAVDFNSQAQSFATEALTAARTITAADNGLTFILTGIVGYALVLPLPAAGLRYKFIVQDLFATTDWVLTATSGIMFGTVMELSTVQAVAAATTINLELAADTIGDWLEVVSDGTNWYVSGACAQAASVTPA